MRDADGRRRIAYCLLSATCCLLPAAVLSIVNIQVFGRRCAGSVVAYHTVTPTEVGAQNFFLSPQSQFRNLKEALLQSQFRDFLKKCRSATATTQSHFFLKSATSRLQLESSTSNNFWPWNPVDSWRKKKKKNTEVKNLVLLSL